MMRLLSCRQNLRCATSVVILLTLAAACKPSRSSQSAGDNPMAYFKEAYTGYNAAGSTESCFTKTAASACPAADAATIAFTQTCTDKGYEAYHCDCNHVLCSKNPFEPEPATKKPVAR